MQESSDKLTNGRTDGRYQVHYLPRFAVDNYTSASSNDPKHYRTPKGQKPHEN